MSRVASIALAVSLTVVTVMAQDQAPEVAKTVDDAVGIEERTQARLDDWAQQKMELVARYRAAHSGIEGLNRQCEARQARIDALQRRCAEYERRLTEAARLRDNLQNTLDAVMARLTDWVARDLPFLPEERAKRLASLGEEMVRPDVTGAEKLRRLLEGLQVEADYGRTVEVDEAEIDLAGEPLYVDTLRLGRLSLFWKTPDGKRVGKYDRAAAAWRELPGKYRRPIVAAMAMASRLRPTELIALPLGRISR